jgi:4-aminobutyrate aminotransferase-like enzyme
MMERLLVGLRTLDLFSLGVGVAVVLLSLLFDRMLRRSSVNCKQQQRASPHPPCPRSTTPCLLEAMSLSKSQVLADRKSFFSTAQIMSHSRVEPLMALRGHKEFVYDEKGIEYLDSRNNVPILGHADERIVRAVADQMSLVNTNSRYLHPNATQLCKELAEVMPKQLCKFFIVSSGSEAIDLSLRLARLHSGHKHVISLTQAYHGTTTAAVEVSHEKIDKYKPHLKKEDWVTIVDNPDIVNGKHATASGYLTDLQQELRVLHGKFAAFIMESIVSVGGGVIPPKGYMGEAFKMVRAAGGVCIADETQIGLGRTGNWWSFQTDGHPDAIPDILVIGKQLGNGFPVSLVATTEQIIQSLERSRIEYFSTFGGCAVACAAALTTVKAIKDDKLVERARLMGEFMIKQIRSQISCFIPSLVKDIRGQGMYIVIQYSSTTISRHVFDSLYKHHNILSTLDGPLDDAMIFKPPLCWSEASGVRYVDAIRGILERYRHSE